MFIVELQNVVKSYMLGSVSVNALKGLNLQITEGDFVSVAGPSGSGKTTIMNIIGLIDKPTSGSILLDGRSADSMSRREITALRKNVIGFVFQSFNLLPVLNVFENVELPLLLSAKTNSSKKERKVWVNSLLESVGLCDRAKHLPSELSGGQQQRVAIARSLVNHPKIVIADEPTANLDSENAGLVLNLMKQVNKTDGTTFIFSTHDSKIWEMANHIVFLKDGLVVKEDRKP
ncbi:MAG: ABC transporter ATP-binding protein [Termitinemataceae bacterium]|nr:MAG: ABC transporter ATP-binding protein [Termitinemataceae bacterium]